MTRRLPRKATQSGLLHEDVTAMIQDAKTYDIEDQTLARQIIVVVRERVLQEIESYARQEVR